MAKLEETFSKILTVVEHFVNTHVIWNSDMTQQDAKGIIDEARDVLNGETDETVTETPEKISETADENQK